MTVVTVNAVSFITVVGSGWSFDASSETPGNPVTVQLWPEVFCSAMSAATWPAPSLAGTTRQVPEGISAVVHVPPPACDGVEDADECAVVGAACVDVLPPAAEAGAVPVADADVVPDPGLTPELTAVVLPAELVLPGDVPPEPALLAVLPEHPAVSAAAPSAPAANAAPRRKTEIRFIEPNLPG